MSTVAELIDSVKHRLESRANVYPAINKAIRLINKRMQYHGSDMATSSMSVSVSANGTTATMPSDFWGLRGLPYINGQTTPLRPLEDKSVYLAYQTAAVPLFYEIQGQTMKLIPATSSAITIKGDYWARPTKITGPADTIPYYEQFDDAIAEFVVEAVKSQPKPESALQQVIFNAVDEIIPIRDMRGSIPFPEGTDWDYLANG